MPTTRAGRLIGAIIILIGAILLIASLVLPWYSVQTSFGGASATQNSYPGLPSTNGTIQYSCSGLPSLILGASCPPQTSYSRQHLNNTGLIAESGFFLIIAGIVLGIIAAVLGIASRGNSRRTSPAVALAVVALLLAIAAPGLFAASLPGAIGKDLPGHTGSGPWSSFFGSASTMVAPTVTLSTTWGPSVGWYCAIVAFVLLLVGLIILFMYRKEPPQPAIGPSSSPPTP
ncbi:MAG: hypothetical protein L3J97_03330 [Thermoplasmata archaeon]|nr:hypothetical protein [Thermoplasmata archaeon]